MKVMYQVGVEGDWGTFAPPTPNVETAQHWLTMDDGTRLYSRVWKAGAPATLLLVHGLGAHGGWFLDMGSALAARGVNVWQVDLRGFGRSEGPRGHVHTYRRYVEDLDAVVDAVGAALPATRLFVLGHSMGALFATYYAAAHPEKMAGLALLNPWIKDQVRVSIGTMLAIAVGGLMKSARPVRAAGGPDVMTENPEAVKLLDSDPYWVREESATFLFQIGLLMRSGVLKQARQVTMPVLVMQAGKDKSVVFSATEAAFRQLGSSDKTWKTYPTYAHDAEFEPDRSALDDDLAAWIKRQTGASERVS